MKKPRVAAITGCFDLPEDAVIEILARLPVNSLLRFKCVCKSWYALIKNLKFISKHLNYTSYNDDHARIALTYCNSNSYQNRKAFFSFLSNKAVQISDDTASTFLDEDNDNNIVYINDMIFYGHCNGIICAVLRIVHPIGNPITLWNPATREIKHLFIPNLHYRDADTVDVFSLAVGFGFDTRGNDYKVIRIIDFMNRRNQRRIFDPVVEIYNLSTDSWRKLEGDQLPKTIQFRTDASTHLNGVFYWLANDADTGKFVLTFDFANEVFEKLPLPEIYPNRVSTLVKFNESVGVIAYKGVFDCIVVWVLNMSKVGEKKTWTKLYTIPSERMVRVIGFLKSGEAIIIEGGQNLSNIFTLYDPSTQQYQYLWVVNGSIYESFQMVDYVESLVSFKGVIRFHTVF